MKRITIAGAIAGSLFVYPAFAQEPATTPVAPAPLVAPKPLVRVEPFASIVGGAKVDTLIQGPTEQREGRASAIAVSLFGLRGGVGDLVTFHSEIMANGGSIANPPSSLHGSSAWEGQAALQVRRQLVRLNIGPWMFEAGRILDEASVNFLSAHVLDTLGQDTAVRDPLLYSGYNMGNGLRGTYEPLPGLRIGLTFTAGNPVATTASLQVGGSFPPFDRFYLQPYQAVKQNPNNYPDDTFHVMLLAPSILYTSKILDAQAEFQGFVVDTNTSRRDDDNIRGYNLRANVRFKIADDTVSPFANVALERNDTVQPNDSTKLAVDKYTGLTWGAGVDLNYAHPYAGRANGVGAQYDRVQYQVGSGNVTNLHYVNVGTSYWVSERAALGARVGVWLRNDVGVHDEGEKSLLLTLRLVL